MRIALSPAWSAYLTICGATWATRYQESKCSDAQPRSVQPARTQQHCKQPHSILSVCVCAQDTRQQVPSKKVIDLMALPPSPGPLDILAVTWGNKAEYAAAHGYCLVNATSSFTSHPASDRPASWNKLRAVRLLPPSLLDLLAAPRLLQRGHYMRPVHTWSFENLLISLGLYSACPAGSVHTLERLLLEGCPWSFES